MSTNPGIGIFLPTMTATGDEPVDIVAAARHAEDLGFESAWVVDQLVAGTGAPSVLDSIVTLAAVAGATQRIGLGLGVLVVPLRPVAWIAKQVATLQEIAAGRVLLGVGVGGDRHDLSWAAAGVPRRERAGRTDAALAVLPDLLAGKPAALPDVAGQPVVQLAPGVTLPPILVGGTADAALRRAVAHGDGWFAMPTPPVSARPSVERLAELASAAGRGAPSLTGSIVVDLHDDAARRGEVERILTDPDGLFGMPAEAIPSILVSRPDDLVRRVAGWADLGAQRVVLTIPGADWRDQADRAAAVLLGGAHPSSAR
jgi:alkanesulfonate monooxygenase SsuD/methylene tetrahydromethanopterin reductase-like flavin-dependent oxidoreductase (luciferase family)